MRHFSDLALETFDLHSIRYLSHIDNITETTLVPMLMVTTTL